MNFDKNKEFFLEQRTIVPSRNSGPALHCNLFALQKGFPLRSGLKPQSFPFHLSHKKTAEIFCGSLNNSLFNKTFVFQQWLNVWCSGCEILVSLIQINRISNRKNIFSESVTVFSCQTTVCFNPFPGIGIQRF